MKYKNYIFDLYGTLVDIHTDERDLKLWKKMFSFYKEKGAVYTPAKMRKTYETLVKEAQKETDEIRIEPVFEKMFTMQGVQVDGSTVIEACHFFRETSTEYLRLYPWTVPMLEKLKKEECRVVLLSNAQRVFTAPELGKLDIEKYFDRIFISSDEGVKKPNISFFNRMLDECNFKKEECLMVGNDEVCDIGGAHKAGLHGFYIHTKISPDYTGEANAEYEMLDADEENGRIDLP